MPVIPPSQPNQDQQPSEPTLGLALGLLDLQRLTVDLKKRLLGGRLDLTHPVWINRDKKQVGVRLACDLLTAATVCDVLNNELRKVDDTYVDVYLLRDGAWRQVSPRLTLTVIVDGAPYLNPEVFDVQRPKSDVDPRPAPQRMD